MNVTEIVTEKILNELKKGCIPWEKSWIVIGKMNLKSKKQYRGINRLLLANDAENYYLTFNQVKSLGGYVKSGSKAQTVIFWKPCTYIKSELNENDKFIEIIESYPLLRYYKVFKLSDIVGIDRPELKNDNRTVESIESFIKRINPDYNLGGDSAHYSPSKDKITVPRLSQFDDTNYYYQTFFHELIHWTGHKTRCNRGVEMPASFGSESYSKEELIAEIGSAMLCHYFGIDVIKHNAGYIDSWLKALNNDKKLIVSACSKAEKAIEYLQVNI